MTEPTQLEIANELLRAALDLLEKADRTSFVVSVLELTTNANGGGDGMCVREELQEYFDTFDVPRALQWPGEDE